MTGVLVALAILSGVGGFVSIPHFLEPLLPMARAQEALEHYETPLIVLSVLLAAGGLAGAVFVYRGGLARADALAARFPRLHRLLAGKYHVDELYDAVLNRPLLWISDRVFLGLGDRFLIDGSLNGLAAVAQRAAGRLSRVETGNLQFYLLLAVLGVVACLGWMLRNG
jgi:NADH-quinone oxidoreductase subunit L